MNQRIAPDSPASRSATRTAGSNRNRPETATATPTGLRGGVAAVAGAVAADADAATAKTMSAAGRRQTATAANRHAAQLNPPPALPIKMPTMSRCLVGMACGLPRGRQPTPAGRVHPGLTASRPGRPKPTTASLEAVAADVADVAKDVAKLVVAMPAAAWHRLRVAVRSPHRAVRMMPAVGVADAAAGARATIVVRHRHSNAAVAMNLPPWREDARRTTRALSSSGLRMPAMKATSVTSVTRQTTTTASSRADSTRCSMCRVGWRRLVSSSQAISKPAADRPAEETAAVAENRVATHRRVATHPRVTMNRRVVATHRRVVARQTGPATPDAAVGQAVNADTWPQVFNLWNLRRRNGQVKNLPPRRRADTDRLNTRRHPERKRPGMALPKY